WGFDVFDAVLFNFVAPDCIPALLHLTPGSRAAHEASVFWTGALTSMLLLGWALGGLLFGWVADRIGRKRALIATITLYAAGTALCALVSNIGQLIACRLLASLGIGGEWGIGAALVAESVPEERRVEAGVIMQTGSPLGVVLAGAVNYQIAGVWLAADPRDSWRYVFLAGLLPVVVALGVRLFLRESAHWTASDARTRPSTPRELFGPRMRAATLSGVFAAVIAVLTWWACNAFIPLLGRPLAAEDAASAGVYGIFGAFTFYLPELFPARLRATGAGFCYNIGRVFAASGPFVIGLVTAAAGGSGGALMRVMCWLALVPLGAALLARFVLLEARGRTLPV